MELSPEVPHTETVVWGDQGFNCKPTWPCVRVSHTIQVMQSRSWRTEGTWEEAEARHQEFALSDLSVLWFLSLGKVCDLFWNLQVHSVRGLQIVKKIQSLKSLKFSKDWLFKSYICFIL